MNAQMPEEVKEEIELAAKGAGANTTEIQPVRQVHGLAFDMSDIDIPRLNIAQKTSAFEAPTGSLVLDKTHVILQPNAGINVVVVKADKMWREDTPFDEDVIPQIAKSPEELAALSAKTTYPIIEFAEIIFMIPPVGEEEPDHSVYQFPIAGKQWAIGKLNVAKDAYRQTFKRLATFQGLNPTTPFYAKQWNLSVGIISKGKYSWWAPSLKATDESVSEEIMSFLAQF